MRHNTIGDRQWYSLEKRAKDPADLRGGLGKITDGDPEKAKRANAGGKQYRNRHAN